MATHSWMYAVSAACSDDVSSDIPYLDTRLLAFSVQANGVSSNATGRVVGDTSSTTTIDLTNVNDKFLGVLNYSGKKVHAFSFKNTGSGNVTVAPGVSNGYQFLSGGPSIVVPPGGIVFGFVGINAPVIGTSARNVTITVASGGTLQYIFLIGEASV